MMKELLGANGAHGGREGVLEEMRREAENVVEVVKNGEKKNDRKTGKVELLGEVHDEHGGSVQKIVERMERGEMGSGTVVALERKEGGEHLGMRDVRMLAEVLRHNGGCKEDERIKLPAGIEGSAIWWDAKLMNEAQKYGVQVVGVEGKSLAHDQHSPEYNKDREDYIAQQLTQLQQQGCNVVMPVGAAHVQGLQARLNVNTAMEAMLKTPQNHAQNGKNTVQKPPQHHEIIANASHRQILGKFTEQVIKNDSKNGSNRRPPKKQDFKF